MPDVALHQWVVDNIKANQGGEETVVCQGGAGLNLSPWVVVEKVTLVGQTLFVFVKGFEELCAQLLVVCLHAKKILDAF